MPHQETWISIGLPCFTITSLVCIIVISLICLFQEIRSPVQILGSDSDLLVLQLLSPFEKEIEIRQNVFYCANEFENDQHSVHNLHTKNLAAGF